MYQLVSMFVILWVFVFFVWNSRFMIGLILAIIGFVLFFVEDSTTIQKIIGVVVGGYGIYLAITFAHCFNGC